MTKCAALVLGLQIDATVARSIARILVVRPLPIGRVRACGCVADTTITSDRNIIEIEVIHDVRIGDKTSIDDQILIGVTVETDILIFPRKLSMICRIGKIDTLMRIGSWGITICGDMASTGEAARPIAPLEIISMTDIHRAARPTELLSEVLMIALYIVPIVAVNSKGRPGNMAAKAAYSRSIPIIIDTVATLAAEQIVSRVNPMGRNPAIRVNILIRSHIGTTASTLIRSHIGTTASTADQQ
jgi:hypothetical protein